MHSDLKIFDGHCDTLDLLSENKSLFDIDTDFNLKKASEYKEYIQVAAIWIDSEIHSPYKRVIEKTDLFNANSEYFKPIRTKEDLINADKTSLILGIEGGDALEGNLANLQKFYDKGIRLITLTWNHKNELSDTAAEPSDNPGLTEFGKKAVILMNNLGIMVDVSHLSEKGFYDVCEISNKPFVASHSDSKAICGHSRNLTDEQFAEIIKFGGVAGINYYPLFLGGKSLDCLYSHIEHFMTLGGENNIGLGSDFDGIDDKPDEISGVESQYLIADLLLSKNYSEVLVNKILSENFKRVFLEILK